LKIQKLLLIYSFRVLSSTFGVPSVSKMASEPLKSAHDPFFNKEIEPPLLMPSTMLWQKLDSQVIYSCGEPRHAQREEEFTEENNSCFRF